MYADQTTAIVMQFVPILVLQLFYAWFVFVLCRKQKWNSWLWTIAALIPVVGVFISMVAIITTQFKILDRLNTLESK